MASLNQNYLIFFKAQSIEEKKHVHVFCGAQSEAGFQALFEELVAAGVSAKRLRKLPGPFVRSTDGQGKLVGYQSLDPQSTTARLGCL